MHKATSEQTLCKNSPKKSIGASVKGPIFPLFPDLYFSFQGSCLTQLIIHKAENGDGNAKIGKKNMSFTKTASLRFPHSEQQHGRYHQQQ